MTQLRARLANSKKARRPLLVGEINIAISPLKPGLLGVRHDNVNQDREPAQDRGVHLAVRERGAEKAQNGRHILRVAAVPIKALGHEALVCAVGVFDAEVEIAVDREAEADDNAESPIAKRNASPSCGQCAVRIA